MIAIYLPRNEILKFQNKCDMMQRQASSFEGREYILSCEESQSMGKFKTHPDKIQVQSIPYISCKSTHN